MRVTRRNLLLGAAAAAAAGAPRARADAGSAALGADMDLLQDVYQTLHPGLYRYQTPAGFNRRCADLKAALQAPLSLEAQYLELSRLLATVRCGHTYANFFNQSRAVAERIVAPANKLPFLFVWLDRRMVVSANPLGAGDLAPGDEILSINGVAAADILARLIPCVRADGANDDKRRALLEVTGTDRIETFDVFYPLVFPGVGGTFRLTVRRIANGATGRCDVSAIDQPARERMARPGRDLSGPEAWRLEWPAPRTAVLTLPSWATYNVKWDWRGRLDEIFEALQRRGATGLVIDLRDNEGGEDCGDEILARLIDAPLPRLAGAERLVRYRSIPPRLTPCLDTWDRSFDHLGEGADDLGDGFFRLRSEGDAWARIVPKGPRFRGRVIVLAGPQNSSATFQFIDLARRAGLARIYGRAIGGNQRGINGGSFYFVRLPHSGLEADLPLVGVFPPGDRPDSGLAPDVWVAPQPQDLVRGWDRALQRALADLA